MDERLDWIAEYLSQHSLSEASHRYAYVLWAFIVAVVVVLSLLRTRRKHSAVLAWARRFTLRRRTIRRRGSYPFFFVLPPNGQLLAGSFLFLVTILLAFAGPDSGLTLTPSTPIVKSWWSVSARNGSIAFALFPLCVLLALKAPPFAIFALSFTTELYFDKLSWLHRWSGRLIWAITAIHVALWSVELAREVRPETGQMAYVYAWKYDKFLIGWVAFGLLTTLVISSSNYFRRSFHLAFYVLHICLVPSVLITSALHHPPVGSWCYAALAVWVGERCWRGTWWLYINGTCYRQDPTTVSSHHLPVTIHHKSTTPNSPYFTVQPDSFYSNTNLIATASTLSYQPPPGFAYAELLSGTTVRLTYTSVERLSWAPGQHFLLHIPSISKLSTHPFTCVSISDKQAPHRSGSTLVFLVSAKTKGGWTTALWNQVMNLLNAGRTHVPSEKPPETVHRDGFGILLKMNIEGPFGGSVATNWSSYSTVIIFAGGSGITFALPILEATCMMLAGRDGKHLGGKSGGWGTKLATKRVRLVWLVREFCHIQWCASTLRRCSSMISEGLQLDIFVTNHALIRNPVPSSDPTVGAQASVVGSRPPASPFQPPTDEDDDDEGLVDLSAYTTEYGDEDPCPGLHEDYTRELTSFDGDDEHDIRPLFGEDALNRTVRLVGRQSRSMSKSFSFTGLRQQHVHVPSGMREMVAVSQYAEEAPASPVSRSSFESVESDITQQPRISVSDAPYFPRPMVRETDFVRPSLPTLQVPTFYPPSAYSPASSTTHDWGMASADAFALDNSPRSSVVVSPFTGTPDGGMKLRVPEEEMKDINTIAEFARPGKPKLAGILSQEVEKSTGSVVVACCGPTSFNGLIRKVVAAEINVKTMWEGHAKGNLELVAEEFSY